MSSFLRAILHSFRSHAWNRRQMIRDRGVLGWLAYEWGFMRFVWRSRNDGVEMRSERTVRDIFMQLRLGFDVMGDVSRWDLIQFARLSGCVDLMEEAMLSAEAFQQRIEDAGGSYPLEGLRQTWNQR